MRAFNAKFKELMKDDADKETYMKEKKEKMKNNKIIDIGYNNDIENISYKIFDSDEVLYKIRKAKPKFNFKYSELTEEQKSKYFRVKNRQAYYDRLLKGCKVLSIKVSDTALQSHQDAIETVTELINQANDTFIKKVEYGDTNICNEVKKEEIMPYKNTEVGQLVEKIIYKDEHKIQEIVNKYDSKTFDADILANFVPKEKYLDLIEIYETHIDKLNKNYLAKLNSLKLELTKYISSEEELNSVNRTLEYTIIDDFNNFLDSHLFIVPYIKPFILENIDYNNTSMIPTDSNYIQNIIDNISLPPITSISKYILSHPIESFHFKQDFKDFAEFIVTDILKNIIILIDKKKFTFLYNYQNDMYKSIDIISLSNEILYGTQKRIKEHVY